MYRNKSNALLWIQKKTGSTVKMLPVRVSAISFDVSENSKPILCGRRLLLDFSVKLFYGHPANVQGLFFSGGASFIIIILEVETGQTIKYNMIRFLCPNMKEGAIIYDQKVCNRSVV